MTVGAPPLPLFVEGYVYDEETNDPIEGVLVCIDENDNCDTTNNSGYYVIEVESPGSKTITASKEGYEDLIEEIDVENEPIQQDIYMTPIPIITTTTTPTTTTITTTTTTTPPSPPPHHPHQPLFQLLLPQLPL